MCEMVCKGQLDISMAQEAIAKDWIAAYHKYYGSALTARWHEGISCAPVQGVKIVTGSLA